MKKIYIIGYYNHNNLGDSQYEETFNYLLNKFVLEDKLEIIYLDCDKIEITDFNDTDIIILGGGDILNNYFLDQIILKFRNKPNKIIAVSVGIPYVDLLINTNKLNIIDYIFLRTQQDMNLLREYFPPHRIFYLPDISLFLTNCSLSSIEKQYSEILLLKNTLHTIKNTNNKKIIAITLSRHIFESIDYDNFLIMFYKFIKYIITLDYIIVLLPFNIDENINSKNIHNDTLIHNDLIQIIKSNDHTLLNKIIIIDFEIPPKYILNIYDYFYITIPMRFHSCLFSIYKKIPCLPIFTTRKVKNLLLDINYNNNYFHKLITNENDLPIKCNNLETILINKFNCIIENYSNINLNLDIKCRNFSKDLIENQITLLNLINTNYLKEFFNSGSDKKINNLYLKIQDLLKSKQKSTDFRKCTNTDLQNTIVQTVSYYLTNGTINSIYNHGLKEKMFKSDYNYINEWKWILTDNIKRKNSLFQLQNNPYGIFNINYIDQIDYSGVHRFGWQYVYDNISFLHNSSVDLLLDLYVDRTFHWNNEVNKLIGLIPYKRNWAGIVHHTFDTSFSKYNCYNLIKNQDFIESLKVCKCLFVLSNTLKIKFQEEFKKLNIKVPIYTLIHPTETNIKLFNYNSFLKNSDKKIIHIGGWLRNIYSFYKLIIPPVYTFKSHPLKLNTKQTPIRKTILKGTNMNNYFPSYTFSNDLFSFLSNEEDNASNGNASNGNASNGNASNGNASNGNASNGNASNGNASNGGVLNNNWYKDFSDDSKYIINSVDILNTADNCEYDKLLSENVIFINLIDASAINTLIECIVRNTPIIINNHPAVIELLGENYPLYFNNNYSNYYEFNSNIYKLLSIPNIFKITSNYLSKLTVIKSKLSIPFFIKDLIEKIKAL